MSTLFTVNLVVNLIFGVGFSFLPVLMIDLYGVELTQGGYLMTRMFGATLLATVALLWYSRVTKDAQFIRGTAISMFAYWLLGSVFLLLAQLAGLFNWLAWATFGFHAAFAGWYGYKFVTRSV